MERRQFLLGLGATAVAATLPAWARESADEYFTGFRRGVKQHPWLGAYAGVTEDLEASAIRFQGRLPAGLAGTLYRNGPALFERAGVRYQHWFDGDGMVQAYTFADGKLSHRGRFVRTKKFLAESDKGGFIYPGFGSTVKSKVPITSADAINPANTNVIAHGGRLLAMWEGGSAHELDLKTLDTRGLVSWRDDFKGMPFSAHPKVEPDGTMWNFGAFDNHLALYKINRAGKLEKAEVLKVPNLAMNHDFVVSARHLIFVLPAMRINRAKLREGHSFIDSFEFPKGEAMRVLTVEKDDFTKQRWYELPPGFVFHFGNAWEEKSGQIRFDCVLSDPGADVMTQTMRQMMRGDVSRLNPGASRSAQVVIDPAAGTLRHTLADEEVEFPRVDPRVVTERNRQLFHTGALGNDRGFSLNAVLRYDLESGKTDSYRFPREYSLEEHIPVPRPGSTKEGDGWLVGCAYNEKTGKTEVNVFDALRLAAGPVATARLPYAIPIGFHGHFLAA
ncbi:MAG: carotenoid oxygenase family protein [Betaproteobacteria bacterium]|nr:carotenoid oxygenase family protein [Betaproteobacteria bacterium]